MFPQSFGPCTCRSHMSFTENNILKLTTCMCARTLQFNYWHNLKWYKAVLNSEKKTLLMWISTGLQNYLNSKNIARPQSCYIWDRAGKLCSGSGNANPKAKSIGRKVQRSWMNLANLVQQTFIYSTVVVHNHSLKYKSSLREAGMFPKVFWRKAGQEIQTCYG